MPSLSDAALRHLRHVADLPDLSGTRYQMVESLGRGGMGAVYRVHDVALGRDVAMKVLSGPSDVASRERLQLEARVLARLEHPGIVPVHDVGTLPDGRVFYVMKLVRGEALTTFAARVSTLSERLRLMVRVADAVAFAHAHGVVHRDLTPANIMVGAFGEVLVMDWGLAHVAAPDDPPAQVVSQSSSSDGGVRVGTPGFVAPEQAAGVADARSDIYSLGVLLAWLLSAERDGRARRQRALEAIIATARAERPEDRYASAELLADDLTRYLDGQTVRAHQETLADRALRFTRTYRVAILLVFAYLLMRIGLLVMRGL